VCNFVVARFPDVQVCSAGVAALRRHGVLAMPLGGYGLPDCLRITIGTAAANQAVVQALKETTA
jgi:histidinol-phosphate aminotransferase